MKSVLNKVKTTVSKTLAIYKDAEVAVYSGYVTVFILTASIPMFMLIMTVVNMMPYFTSADFAALLKQFLPELPQVQSMITTIITNLNRQSSGILASVAAITTLWSASNGIAALQKALVKIDRDAEKSIYDRPKALLFTILFSLVIIAVLGFQILGDTLQDIIHNILDTMGVADMISGVTRMFNVSSILTALGALLVLLFSYTYLPAGKRPIRRQIPGTILSGIVLLIFSALFAYFIRLFWHSSAFYGSLASVFLITLWLRFSVMIILIGAAFNRSLLETEEESAKALEEEMAAEEQAAIELEEDEFYEANAVKEKVSGTAARVRALFSNIASFIRHYKWLIVAIGTAAGIAGAYFGVKARAADRSAGGHTDGQA